MPSRYPNPTPEQVNRIVGEWDDYAETKAWPCVPLVYDESRNEWEAKRPSGDVLVLTEWVDALIDGMVAKEKAEREEREAAERRARFDDPPTDEEMAALNAIVKRNHKEDYIHYERSRPTFRTYSRMHGASRDCTDWALGHLDRMRGNRTPLFLYKKVDEFEESMYSSGAYNAAGSDADWVREFVAQLKTDYPEAFAEE